MSIKSLSEESLGEMFELTIKIRQDSPVSLRPTEYYVNYQSFAPASGVFKVTADTSEGIKS